MANIVRLSNVVSNKEFFRNNFFMETGKLGNAMLLTDGYVEVFYAIMLKKFENCGIEFNRENVKEQIAEFADGYVNYEFYRNAFDHLYEAYMLKDGFKYVKDVPRGMKC